jgi:hypothetical protein
LAALAAAIALLSLSHTLANVVAKVDPARAHLLAPWDGQITAAHVRQRFTLSPESAHNSQTARLARLALRQDATTVDALSVLGLQAQLRSDTEQARGLFAYSHILSRRELRSQIWAIEEAVARGDIAGALRQYDVALRTSRNARDLLFPVLAGAVAEPMVRSVMVRTLTEGAEWVPHFIHYLAESAFAPDATVLFFREGERVGLPIQNPQKAILVNTLVAKGLFDEAWSFYVTFRTGADRRQSRDFSSAVEIPTPFDWRVIDSPGMFGSLQESEMGTMINFSAVSGASGPAAQQFQMLPPGIYRIEGTSAGVEQPDRSLPYWLLACRDGRELGRVTVPNSMGTVQAFAGRFTVPATCPVQSLSLIIRPSDELGGVEGTVDQLRLAPAR